MKTSLDAIFAVLLLLFFSAAAPARADMPLSPQALQGSWLGNYGQNTLVLMLWDKECGLALNSRLRTGVWNIDGNRQTMQFKNGKSLSFSVALKGLSLILDGNLCLTRTTCTGANGFVVEDATGNAPLEGTWST